MKTLPFSDVTARLRTGAQPAVAAIRKRVQARSALALTLAAEQVLVALVRRSGDGEGSVVAINPVAIGADDVYRHPERAGAMLAEALDAAGVREKRCAVAVPPGWVLTASTELPEVGTEDLRGYLELRAEREFSVPPGELRLGYCPYTLPDGTRRATLAALPSKRLEAVEAFLVAAGGRRAVSVSLAIDGGLLDAQSTLRLVSDGGRTEVVVTAGGGVAALRSLPGPVMGRQPSDGETGEVVHAFDPAAFSREVRITLGRLPSAVQEQVRVVYFSGAREAAALVRAEAGERLRSMGLDLAPEDEDAHAVPAAQEAAAIFLRREAVPFEFIVPLPRPWEIWLRRFNTPRGRRIAAAVLAVIFLPLFVFFIRSQQESSLAAEWRGMDANVADLDALQQQIRRFHPWFDRTPTTVQLLESLFAGFPEAGDVWAKSIVVKGATVTCTGFARDQGALSALRERLRTRPDVSELHTQQVRGENPVQFTLVYHWGATHDR